MIAVRLEELFEICLEELETGTELETILSHYPDQANELRPLLQAVLDGQQLAAEISPPPSAQALSRAQFLTAAARMAPEPGKLRFTWFHLRLATSMVIFVGILAAILLGTGLASANALPGDVFYPVKLMVEQIHMNLVQDPPARLELQENYDDRRLAEVERLNQMKRRETVTFSGLLEQTGPDQWQVGSLPLVFPQGVATPSGLNDAYVQITGYADHDSVEVEELEPRQVQWSGILQQKGEQSWLIGGITLLINGNTQVSGGQPQLGQPVQVTAIRLSENRYLALNLAVTGQSATLPVGKQPQTTPSQTSPARKATSGCSEGSDNCKQQSTPVPSLYPTDDDKDENPPSQSTQTAAPAARVSPTGVVKTDSERTPELRSTPKISLTPTLQATKNAQSDGETSTAVPTTTQKPNDDKEQSPQTTPAPTQKD